MIFIVFGEVFLLNGCVLIGIVLVGMMIIVIGMIMNSMLNKKIKLFLVVLLCILLK